MSDNPNSSSRLEILGIYRPFISKRAYREQWSVTASNEQTEAHFKNLVLIEAVLHGSSSPLNLAEVGQQYLHDDQHPYPDNFQVAYDEALLSLDGKHLLDRRVNCVKGIEPLRFAFYLHFYDPNRPLSTPLGEPPCPLVQPIPPRLRRLVPYRAC